MFIVYVGGIMILIRYCVILIPSNKFGKSQYLTVIVGAGLMDGVAHILGSIAYGLLYRAGAITLVALLLYLVMLAIVEIINYSRGIIKYV